MTNAQATNPAIPTDDGFGEVRLKPQGNPILRFARRKPIGAFGAIILTAAAFTALFAPLLAPYGFNITALGDRLLGPTPGHWLGTDELGRDLMSRLIYGARVSITISLGAVVIASSISLTLGGTTGYFGGTYDLIFLRFVDAWLALPGLVTAIILVGMFGQSVTMLMLVIGLTGGVQQSRVVRAAVLDIKHRPYVEAAKSLGATELRMMLRHILPNIMPILIVLSTTALGGYILAEAGLSFLGYGVPPPTPTWGGMLAGSAVQYMVNNPSMVIFPGLVLALTVYSANMFGDALRDVLDPRLRGSR